MTLNLHYKRMRTEIVEYFWFTAGFYDFSVGSIHPT